MRLPYMSPGASKNKRQIVYFGGVNYSQGAREGELLESTGLSSAQFPCLSQRAGRKTAAAYVAPSGLYARGKLCVVDGTALLYDGRIVGHVTAGEKQFATINTKIVIFPDKAYYDTASGEFGSLEAVYPIYTGDAVFTANTLTVPEQSYIDRAAEKEETLTGVSASASVTVYTGVSINKSTGAFTFTGSSTKTPAALKEGDITQYQCESGEYLVVKSSAQQSDGTFHIAALRHKSALHKYPEFPALFSKGDAVELSGCSAYPGNNGSHIIRGVSGRTLTFDAGIFQTGTEPGVIEAARKVPDLVCICECDNRIWGAAGTTIYASALGDPKNFYVYDGLSTDSFAAAVGTDGDFTACIAYSSTVLFWKENYVHKVLGSYPAQYEIYTYNVPGVQKGAAKSLCIVNQTLFYKGREGVYAYTGGTPELLTECFGTRRFSGGVAGTDGVHYYISMQTERGDWELYALDITRGVWLREDDTWAEDWAYLDGTLYYLDGKTGRLMSVGQDRSEEGPVSWSATLCPFNETVHGRKGYSRLYLRADLEAGAWVKAEVSADGAPFKQVYLGHNDHAKTLQIPILPTRCDTFTVRLSGKGECVIKSFVREFSVGSEY